MKKTYKSLSHLMRIVVRVNGNPVNVEFTKAHLGKGLIGSSYATDNEDLQRAIESNEYFNRPMSPNIWTDDVEKLKTKAEIIPEPENVIAVEEPIEVLDEEPIAENKRGRKPKTK